MRSPASRCSPMSPSATAPASSTSGSSGSTKVKRLRLYVAGLHVRVLTCGGSLLRPSRSTARAPVGRPTRIRDITVSGYRQNHLHLDPGTLNRTRLPRERLRKDSAMAKASSCETDRRKSSSGHRDNAFGTHRYGNTKFESRPGRFCEPGSCVQHLPGCIWPSARPSLLQPPSRGPKTRVGGPQRVG